MKLDKRQCKHIKDNGSRCNSLCRGDSDYCFWHDPEITEEEKKKARESKKISLEVTREDIDALQISDITDLPTIINKCLKDVYCGKIDTKTSNSISSLIKNYKDVIETVLLIKKIELLEEKLHHGKDEKELYEYKE